MISNTQPSWWTEEKHGSAWQRVKDAMKRDWEQTKHDLSGKGTDLDQDVDDTVKQAAGKEAIPPLPVPNAPSPTRAQKTGPNTFEGDYDRNVSWEDAESPIAFGYGGRDQYGAKYAAWNDELESTLRKDWDATHKNSGGRKWNEVKAWVRMGFDRARP